MLIAKSYLYCYPKTLHFSFIFRCSKFTVRLPDTLHLRRVRRHPSFNSHPAGRRDQDQNAALPDQVQRFMVRSRVCPQQVRHAGLLQGHGAEDAQAHPHGRHGLDRVRATDQEYRP